MRRLRISKAAQGDLESIFRYVTAESTSLAIGQRLVDQLTLRCRKLASLPGTLGRARPELGPGVRSFPVGNYLIFLRYDPNEMVVLNVLHGNRDVITPIGDDQGGLEN